MTTIYSSLSELPLERVTEQFSRRTLVGQQEMVVWASMAKGSRADTHSHPHEQIFWVVAGKMEFRVGDQRKTCSAGDLVLIPGGTEHEAWCAEASEFVTMLAPVRNDLLPGAGVPDHLRCSRSP